MMDIKTLLHQGKIKETLAKFRALSEAEQEDFFREIMPILFFPPFVSVLFRKLKAGKTYEDFHDAWLPPLTKGQDIEDYYPFPVYGINGQNTDDPSDIISMGLTWAQEEQLMRKLKNFHEKESFQLRHEKITAVVDTVAGPLFYKVKDVTKLGS
ncbi:MAG: hypothetical protein HYX35_02830 [Proteobacteria bacterium]|nr:hypothetical protein [Pseudomonadota bacterium]